MEMPSTFMISEFLKRSRSHHIQSPDSFHEPLEGKNKHLDFPGTVHICDHIIPLPDLSSSIFPVNSRYSSFPCHHLIVAIG